MRYNATERIGVQAVGLIVSKDLGWIFREQPIADIGIDAFIEQVYNDIPTGKFLALQIKSGEGNFHLSEEKITYYASQIHYNYWLNLNIPILMVAHFPLNNLTYWQNITESNFRKTKRQWKLDIPKSQLFDSRSTRLLAKIVDIEIDGDFKVHAKDKEFDNKDMYEVLEKVKSISYASEAITNIASLNNKITDFTNQLNEKLNDYGARNMDLSHIRVKSTFKAYSKQLIYYSSKIEKEIEMFADFYSEGVFALSSILVAMTNLQYDFSSSTINFDSIIVLPEIFQNSIETYTNLTKTVVGFSKIHSSAKSSGNTYLEVLNMLITEFEAAKNITLDLIECIPEKFL